MKYLRKELQGMTPYHSNYITDGVILNANESPFNVPDEILELFKKELENINFNRYPDMDNTILRAAIAKSYHLDITNVTCGVGSDEMLDTLFKAVCSNGDLLLVSKPTFSMYKEFAKLHDTKVYEVDLNADFTFNVDAFIKAIKKENPKMIILCNPNNPTGTLIKREDIIKVLESTSSLVILDEAYMEFYGEGNIDLISKYDNLIILRTFSKLYALASMRCGYALGQKENIDVIDTAKSPYNLNEITLRLATVVIKNKELYANRIEYFKKERESMYNTLKSLGIEVYPSASNFLWMRLSDEVVAECDKRKIYIRKMTYNNLKYNRVCIGTKEENEAFLEVVRNYA